jgi:hypothetical protein
LPGNVAAGLVDHCGQEAAGEHLLHHLVEKLTPLNLCTREPIFAAVRLLSSRLGRMGRRLLVATMVESCGDLHD